MKKYPEGDRPLVSYRFMDLYESDFGPEFDLVVCYSCLPYFSDILKAIQVLGDCLRRGGRLAIAHSSSREHVSRVHEEGGAEICTDILPGSEIVRAMMERAGLTTVFEQYGEEYYVVIAKRD